MTAHGSIKKIILAHLEGSLAANGLTPETVPDGFDLLREGVVDSLGFIELVSLIESETGMQIDFDDMDPEQLTVIGPLCRYVESKTCAKEQGTAEVSS